MPHAREREGEPGEARFEVQEWMGAVLILGAVLVGGMAALGLVYLLVSGQ